MEKFIQQIWTWYLKQLPLTNGGLNHVHRRRCPPHFTFWKWRSDTSKTRPAMSARGNLNTTHQDDICFKLFIFTALCVRAAYEVSHLKPDLWFIVIYNNTKTSHKRQINTQMLFQHLLWEKEFWASAKEWRQIFLLKHKWVANSGITFWHEIYTTFLKSFLFQVSEHFNFTN